MSRFTACILSILLLVTPVAASAQTPDNTYGRPAGELRVYLVTFGPGVEPWEKFGHDAIVIEDADWGLAYNWGVFDFGQGFSGLLTFGWHFLQGRLLYSMQHDDTEAMLDSYVAAGRSILVQELRLSPSQKIALCQNLQANDTDARRYYLYDYFRKNCTTMARDAIDQVVDGRIASTLKSIPAGTTLRWHDRRATAGQLWLYLFLDFQLGHAVDKPLSAYDECFLPGVLARRLPAVQVPDGHGGFASIVLSHKVLNVGTIPDPAAPPGLIYYDFLGFGLGAGLCLALLALVALRLRVVAWLFNLLVMAWSLFVGLFGAIDTFAWFTNHEAAKWNENWFQGNVLSLTMIVLAPAAFRWPRAARRMAALLLGLSVFGLMAKLTPWFYQANWDIISAALPVHAAVAFGIFRLTQRRLEPQTPTPRPTTEHQPTETQTPALPTST